MTKPKFGLLYVTELQLRFLLKLIETQKDKGLMTDGEGCLFNINNDGEYWYVIYPKNKG